MTPNQIASLSLKLIGIYSIIEAIPLLMSLSQVFAWGQGLEISKIKGGPINRDLLLIGILLSFSLLLLIGVFLLIFSKDLAIKMVSEGEPKDSSTELSAKNIQSMAFSIVGLVMMVIAIPHLVELAANLLLRMSAGDEMPVQGINIGIWAYSIGLVAQFILGILIFLGGRGLSSMWFFFQKLRPMRDL